MVLCPHVVNLLFPCLHPPPCPFLLAHSLCPIVAFLAPLAPFLLLLIMVRLHVLGLGRETVAVCVPPGGRRQGLEWECRRRWV